MDIYDVISKQIESYSEQKKEEKLNRKDNVNFLKMANTLITIDDYINILEKEKYAAPSAIKILKKDWKELLLKLNLKKLVSNATVSDTQN